MPNSKKYFKIQNYFLIFLFIYLQIYLNEGMDGNRGKNIMEDNGWSDGEKGLNTSPYKGLGIFLNLKNFFPSKQKF